MVAPDGWPSGACDTWDATQLGWGLTAAEGNRAAVRFIADFAGNKGVFFSLDPTWDAAKRITLVKAMYAAERRQFAYLARRISTELIDDPGRAQLARRFAIADAEDVEQMRQKAFAESKARAARAASYIHSSPQSRGIPFNCGLACHQLIAAAQGLNVFD